MVDFVQEVKWVYKEGPSIGSYSQVTNTTRPSPSRRQSTGGTVRRSLGVDSFDFGTPVTPHTWQARLGATGNRVATQVSRFIGEDWALLAFLGVSTALIGFLLDLCISVLQGWRRSMAEHGTDEVTDGLSFAIWMTFSVLVACLSVACTHHISPQGIGSGIPEMKVILKGVDLAEYLSFRTLVSKVVGLLFALGSGLPIGKEGPFVHISSIITERFIRNFSVFGAISKNSARRTEMLAAACAVGVASDFGAPIGGLLFSIEVTSTYFAVRNYWRGFFASVVAAFVFRLLSILVTEEKTITLLFTTDFDASPFELWEIPVFMVLGATCGILGAFFVYACRRVVEMRRKLSGHWLFKNNRYAYTVIVASFIACVSFPGFLGKQMGMAQKTEINHLFEERPLQQIPEWSTGSIFFNLIVFILVKFTVVPLAASLPIPAGVFVPVFVLGAGIGRLFGEVMLVSFPEDAAVEVANGTACDSGFMGGIVPGGYAVVGAAAMAGSVTQTISTSVIVFELTGQLHHILPVMISVLIANMICQKYSPSIYDSIIQMKNLPYLPDLRKGDSYNMTAADIMKEDAEYVSLKCSYRTIYELLNNSAASVFPLVDAPESQFLIGAVQRSSVEALLDMHTELSALEDDYFSESDAPLMDDESPSSPRIKRPNSSPRRQSSKVLKEGLLANEEGWGGRLHEEQQSLSDGSVDPDNQMDRMIDLSGIPIDPSPFQIVDQTSLYKVHTLFALLGVSVAYVTARGKLIGVVGHDEIRKGIETAGGRRLEARPLQQHPRNRVQFERVPDTGIN